MVAGGFLLALLLLAIAGAGTGIVGAWLFKRLRRTYSLYTIGYYLAELEEKGAHKFPPPDQPQEQS